MSDNVIHLLPDAVANQIAAGEVVQRPASVVKELVENSIDAGAKTIRVNVVDAGRTTVQVIDDGCGMSPTDARMAFERHATSKIREAADIYSLHTKGFRGEALASIAAVAQVDLITRRDEDELGTKISIAAARLTSQEELVTPKGTQIIVHNLFFNIPARRRFLKSNSTELRHIQSEFIRVALAHPEIAMTLTSDSLPLLMFVAGNLKQRVAAVAGKALAQNLLPIEANTSIVKIRGFVGTPQTAKKTGGDQYFFANDRFMKHPYLHKAVTDAYKNLIASDLTPAYFIYIDVDPQTLDVNIHPQKTEIKFENDSSIWQILNATVHECLGRYNIIPSLDFDEGNAINIPVMSPDTELTWTPDVLTSREAAYNPFDHEDNAPSQGGSHGGSSQSYTMMSKMSTNGWEQLYAGLERSNSPAQSQIYNSSIGQSSNDPELFASSLNTAAASTGERFLQLRGRFIVTQVQSGLMIIDQSRAHERIQYDSIARMVQAGRVPSQALIFPEQMPLGTEDACIIEEMGAELANAGMETRYDAETGMLVISAVPGVINASDASRFIEALLYDFREGEVDVKGGIMDYVVRTLASQSAISYGKELSNEEMADIYDKLFASSAPSITPRGKTVFTIIKSDDIEALF